MIERRGYVRLRLYAEATLCGNDKTINGEVVDFTMSGLFLKTTTRLNVGETVAVTIRNTSVLNVIAKVVRVTDLGLGLQFQESL